MILVSPVDFVRGFESTVGINRELETGQLAGLSCLADTEDATAGQSAGCERFGGRDWRLAG